MQYRQETMNRSGSISKNLRICQLNVLSTEQKSGDNTRFSMTGQINFLRKMRTRVGTYMKPQLRKPFTCSLVLKRLTTTSRSGIHSIESSIAVEAKITQLMRRLELLEVREPNLVNQVNPTQMSSPGCTYCDALTHIFEECPIYQAQQMLPDSMTAAYIRSNYNPYSKTHNPGWRNHYNFSQSQRS